MSKKLINFASRNMSYNTFTLPNGLRIIHLTSTSPVVYCGYGVCAGARDEAPDEEGIAHFCEHTTFKGTTRRNSLKILKTLENVGGDLNAFTNKEDTFYYAAILKEHLPKAVDLLTDMVFHSTYPQSELDKEVEVICDEIDIYDDSLPDLIYDDFENMIFKGHAIGHYTLGKKERIRRFTTEDATRFTRSHYTPDNMVFFAYGDVDFKTLTRLLKKATSDFPARKPKIDIAPTGSFAPYIPQDRVVDKEAHQAHVMIGTRAYSAHDPRRKPLYLLNNILGGPGQASRFKLRLREQHGLVYSVDSTTLNYTDTGVWCVYFGCDEHDKQKCQRLVRQELDRVMNRPLSAAQLNAAKRQIKGQLGVASDNRESFALDFAKGFLHYGLKRDIAQLFNEIDNITANDIQSVANDLFQQGSLTTLTYI